MKKYLMISLVLGLVHFAYGDVMIGDFETGLAPWDGGWDGGTLTPSGTGVTEGYQSCQYDTPNPGGWAWGIGRNGILDLAAQPILSLDITWFSSEWTCTGDNWVEMTDVYVNSDGVSGGKQYGAGYLTDLANPSNPGQWDPVNWGTEHTRTLVWDLSEYDPNGATWMQILFSSDMASGYNPANGGTPGSFYIDNVRLLAIVNALFTAVPNPAAPDQNVSFDASASYCPDPCRSIVLYEWDFEYDGVSFVPDDTGMYQTHSYSLFGSYDVALRVTDDDVPPNTAKMVLKVEVTVGNDAPSADGGGPYNFIYGGCSQLLDSSGSTPGWDDGTYGDEVVLYEWDLDGDGEFDDHITADAVSPVSWKTLSSLSKPLGDTDIYLRVTDSLGATNTASTTLTIIYRPMYWPKNEKQKLVASDGDEDNYFGGSVSISGDYAIMGAYGNDSNGSYSGSAYVFAMNDVNCGEWDEQAKLVASDGTVEDFFGQSVSISGDYAIVGSPGDDDNGNESGSAYIFKREGTSWSEQAKLTASDGAADNQFGDSVSISGDYAIVGSPRDDDNGNESGSAYIFKREGTSWSEQAKLTASDGAAYDYFGQSVSISGDYAIIGAPYDDDNGSASGSAYIFKRNWTSWSEQVKLVASDGNTGDSFGGSISISGDYAIIGALGDDDNGSASGSAYIFKRNGTNWSEQAKLTASDGTADDYLGRSVSISGGYAIVGASGDDDNGSDSGSSYIFKRDGTSWGEQVKLLASDGAIEDEFGYSVSISGDYAIVGAYNDCDNGSFSGSAYVFGKVLCPASDLNGDCFVNFRDVAVLASEWLEGAEEP